MQQKREPDDLPKQLQELGLPILECVPEHFHDKSAHLDWRSVHCLFVHIGEPTEDPVTDQAQNEEANGHPGKAVFSDH